MDTVLADIAGKSDLIVLAIAAMLLFGVWCLVFSAFQERLRK